MGLPTSLLRVLCRKPVDPAQFKLSPGVAASSAYGQQEPLAPAPAAAAAAAATAAAAASAPAFGRRGSRRELTWWQDDPEGAPLGLPAALTTAAAATVSTAAAAAGAVPSVPSAEGAPSGLGGFLLIHKTDLARLAPAWARGCAELAGPAPAAVATVAAGASVVPSSKSSDPQAAAYALAAAAAGLRHVDGNAAVLHLGTETSAGDPPRTLMTAPIGYC